MGSSAEPVCLISYQASPWPQSSKVTSLAVGFPSKLAPSSVSMSSSPDWTSVLTNASASLLVLGDLRPAGLTDHHVAVRVHHRTAVVAELH